MQYLMLQTTCFDLAYYLCFKLNLNSNRTNGLAGSLFISMPLGFLKFKPQSVTVVAAFSLIFIDLIL